MNSPFLLPISFATSGWQPPVMKPKREEKQDFHSLTNPGIWGYRIHSSKRGFLNLSASDIWPGRSLLKTVLSWGPSCAL